jgi:hypothetical protein
MRALARSRANESLNAAAKVGKGLAELINSPAATAA